MRPIGRGLSTLLAAVALVVLPVCAGSAPAVAAGSATGSTVGIDQVGEPAAAAIRAPRPPQSFAQVVPATLPSIILAAGLVLLLVTLRRAPLRQAAVSPRRLNTVRGPPAPSAR